MQDMVESERETLIENVAEADDALIERYLEGETITNQELRDTLKKGIPFPHLCTGALRFRHR
jgi:elongation factor G